jgi:hypothetical protein
MIDNNIIKWLLEGDVSIQYQAYRDLLKTDRPDLKERISAEGWGARFLSLRNNDGHWGSGFYLPKWISSHYTLLDLKNLAISSHQDGIKQLINKILLENKSHDGGVSPVKSLSKSDVCVNGMFLNYSSYFGVNENDLKSVVDCILSSQMTDGGFNCQFKRKGTHHSSLHSTLSVIEGISEYRKNGYKYMLNELIEAEDKSREFILEHKLYQSHRTGKIIDNKMLMLSYPSRWRYDILRALDYFQSAGCGFDNRMTAAIEVLIRKRRSDKTWPLQKRHNGLIHFNMELPGTASRWNTLRALRVLNQFDPENE